MKNLTDFYKTVKTFKNNLQCLNEPALLVDLQNDKF